MQNEPRTFYGEWIDISNLRTALQLADVVSAACGGRPKGTLWEMNICDRRPKGSRWMMFTRNYTTGVMVANVEGFLIDDNCDVAGNIQLPDKMLREQSRKLRRVYPPGSVLPEPRELTDIPTEALDNWEHWMVLDCQAPYLKWEHRTCVGKLSGARAYPVQVLENGALVAVPWFAVEEKNTNG